MSAKGTWVERSPEAKEHHLFRQLQLRMYPLIFTTNAFSLD